MKGKSAKVLSIILALSLIFQQLGFAQVAAQLNLSRFFQQFQPTDKFRPLQLRSFSFDERSDRFELFLDKGDVKNLKGDELRLQGQDLFKYFLTGLTLPNSAFWVNLRPDAEDQIIDPRLGMTDVGKILLEADLQLKKDTAMFTSPENPQGKEYWERLYKKAGEIFGTENITIPTLTRPWIVPNEVIVRYSGQSAYVYKATLKVMLEQDYLKDSSTYNFNDPRMKELNEYASQQVRELIIPQLNKEINQSKRYAQLRQVYYSLILAQWFKQNCSGGNSRYSRMIDRGQLEGLVSEGNWSKSQYFNAYKKSFEQGEYNIKSTAYGVYGPNIRTYFSGGMDLKVSSPTSGIDAARLTPQTLLRAGHVPLIADTDGRLVEMTLPPERGSIVVSSPVAQDPNLDIRSAVEPPYKYAFSRKVTIPYAVDNRVFFTAEGRRNARQYAEEVLKKVQENVLTVVFGKDFEGGKQVKKRGSADANLGWTDLLRERHPLGLKSFFAQVEFTQKGIPALMRGDSETYNHYLNEYVKSRSDASKAWLDLMLRARKGEKGLPLWVYERLKVIQDNPNEYANFLVLFDDIDQGRSPVDYDLYAPDDIGKAMQAVAEFNKMKGYEAIGLFALGAGGAGTVNALSPSGRNGVTAPQVAQEFLKFLEEKYNMKVPQLITEAGIEAGPGQMSLKDLSDLTSGEGKYATGRHTLAFWVKAKADLDGVIFTGVDDWNQSPVLTGRGLKLQVPEELPWALVNKYSLEVIPIEDAVDAQGNVRQEYIRDERSVQDWIVVRNWDLSFDWKSYFRVDKPILSDENVKLVNDRIQKNGFQGVFSELWSWAKENGKKIIISAPARWLDTLGSSQDLKDFRLSLTPEGDLRLDILPSCNAIPSEYRVKIEISAIDNPNVIEYEAEQYFKGTHRVNPNKIEFLSNPNEQPEDAEAVIFVKHPIPQQAERGIQMLKRKERDLPALFARLFNISGGLKFKCERMAAVPQQGGMESSNIFTDSVVAICNMLSGANFSISELSHISLMAQINEANNITGNQGADAAWAGAGLHVYMGGMRDSQAQRNFAAVQVTGLAFPRQVAFSYQSFHPKWGVVSYDVPESQQKVKVELSQLQALHRALERLPQGIAGRLGDMTMVVLPDGDILHYSLGRPQVTLSISLLQNGKEDELALRLWRAIMTRELILSSLKALGLDSQFEATQLDPRSRETTMVNVGGQEVTLLQVINNLAEAVNKMVYNSELEMSDFGTLDDFMWQGTQELAFIRFNLVNALRGNMSEGEFIRDHEAQLKAAAGEIYRTMVALRGTDLSNAQVKVKLDAIDSVFSAVQDDVKRFMPGEMPVGAVPATASSPVNQDLDAVREGVREVLLRGNNMSGITDADLEAAARYLTGQGGLVPNSIITVLNMERLGEIAERALRAAQPSEVGASSPTGVGGIDFRYINMVTQAQLINAQANFKMPDLQVLKNLDLVKESAELKKLMAAGIMPAQDRIIEFVAACRLHNQDADDAFICIVDYLKIQESEALETDTQFKGFLTVIDSQKVTG